MEDFKRFEGNRILVKFWNNIEKDDVVWLKRGDILPPATARIVKVEEDEKYTDIVRILWIDTRTGDVDYCYHRKNEPFDVVGQSI